MKFMFTRNISLLALIVFSLASCSEKKEELMTEPVADYSPLAVGKYITYRIDSLVFVDFQHIPEIHSYQVKHVVDAEIVDNLGRPSFRIYRYLNNTSGTGEWVANGSYFITPTENQLEVIEDNLRFIKLHGPLREGYSWKGNSYLPTDPYDFYGYNFSNDDDIKDWDYYYTAPEAVFNYSGIDYNDVFTVEQQDDLSNVPVDDPTSYGYRSRAVDKYAKNIGLVYRQYELWEYQPNLSGSDPYYTGFGITMWMIDHN